MSFSRPKQSKAVATTNGKDGRIRHIPLIRARCLYIGSAVPLDTALGVESVQKPLSERYCKFDGDKQVTAIDAQLTIYTSGILLQYVEDPSTYTWFPIQSLHVAAAVKAADITDMENGSQTSSFVAVDSPKGRKSRHPPIFALIARRTRGVKILECHGFICKTDEASMALVHASTHAFNHKEGWQDDMPSDIENSTNMSRIVNVERKCGSRGACGKDFFAKPSADGHFYAKNESVMKKYDVRGYGGSNEVENSYGGSDRQVVEHRFGGNGKRPRKSPDVVIQPIIQDDFEEYYDDYNDDPYFDDWGNDYYDPFMFTPESPFYPGDDYVDDQRSRRRRRERTPSPRRSRRRDDNGEEEELYYIRRRSRSRDRDRDYDRRGDDYYYDNGGDFGYGYGDPVMVDPYMGGGGYPTDFYGNGFAADPYGGFGGGVPMMNGGDVYGGYGGGAMPYYY